MSDSLVIDYAIETLGGGVQCALPPCQNAAGVGSVFSLAPGYDQGSHVPVTDVVVANILDGDRPLGERSGNRLITLPLVIRAPDYQTLAGSKETVMKLINQDQWVLKWVRDNYISGLPSPVLITNATFESGIAGWTAENGVTLAQSATQIHSGAFSGRLTPNGVTAVPQIEGPTVPVLPGQGCGFSFWLTSPVLDWSCSVSVHYKDSTGTHIVGADQTTTATIGNLWQQMQVVGMPPAGAVSASAFIQMNGTPAASTLVYCDDGINAPASAFTELLGLPMLLECYRANQTTIQYSSRREKDTLVGILTVQFEAAPYGKSDQPTTVSFASPVQGTSIAPSPPVSVEAFQSGYPHKWASITNAKVGAQAAQYTGYTSDNQPAFYSKSGLALDFTGMASLGHWLGFSADPTVWGWNYLWGTTSKRAVHVTYTLSDNQGHKITFGRTYYCRASMKLGSPRWQYVSVPLPQNVTFNFANVTAWSISIANHWTASSSLFTPAPQLKYTVPSLDQLSANPVSTQPISTARSALYQINTIGSVRAPLNLQVQMPAGTATPVTIAYRIPGAYNFPSPFGVTTSSVIIKGAGGPGSNLSASGGAGGGGAEWLSQTAFALTAGQNVPVIVGLNSNPGADGGDSSLGTLIAKGGKKAVGNTPGAVSGAGTGTATARHAGAAGGAGVAGGGAGGGGSSGGSAVAGNTGAAGSGGTGGAGGAAPAGGSAGGKGGNTNKNGTTPSGTGGGGGGGGNGGVIIIGQGVRGAPGLVQITYTPAFPSFATALVHIPGPRTPLSLMPLVNLGDGQDVPDGTFEYSVVSSDPAGNAQFNGTYSILLASSGFATPTASRKVTVTLNQYPYDGGTPQSTSVSANFIPNNLPLGNGFVTIGEITLPILAIPADNTQAFFTLTVTSTNTADRFLDCILVDTAGQMILISAPITYQQFWIDEPATTQTVGPVYGSQLDRDIAQSVLGNCLVSGGPLLVEPGDNNLLVYTADGPAPPSVVAVYMARWLHDRLA